MQATSAALYGKGIFTTIPIHDGCLVLWEKHWKRLTRNAAIVDIDLSELTEDRVLSAIGRKAADRRLINGRMRITLLDERQNDVWPSEKVGSQATSLQILAGEKRHLPDAFRLTMSPYPMNSCSPLAGVKSCNYLEQILSLDEAKSRGFHEAVRVNERGHVTSGCMSNIFWLKDERLYTPTLATGCLAGTTREYVLETIDCEEVEAEIGELESADAIYLTSAGLGIVRVAEFDGRELTAGDHPIIDLWPPKDAKTRMPTIGQS